MTKSSSYCHNLEKKKEVHETLFWCLQGYSPERDTLSYTWRVLHKTYAKGIEEV